MKNKKLIALLCTAAMAATAFSGLTVFAEGEEPAAEVELTSTTTFDFESDAASITTEDVNSGMTLATVDTSTLTDAPSTLGSKALSFTGTSTETSKYAYANFDLSSYTKGKKRVVIEYDAYFPDAGRMVYAMSDDGPSGYDPSCIWSQGTSGSNPRNITDKNTWLHTVLDVTFADGAGVYTYKVTDSNGKVIQTATEADPTRTLKTSKQELINFIVTSWSPATAYIDNITIKTGGEYEYVYEDPESASTVEGSDIDLLPEDAVSTFDGAWAEAVEKTEKVLNHSKADKAQTTSNGAINVYETKAKSASIFAAFDLYLTPGSSFSLVAYGDGGKATGPSLTFTADKSGIVTAREQHDNASKAGAVTTLSSDLRHGTWYRVVAEYQTINEEGADPKLGETIYTIYRIDPKNPSKTLGVAGRALKVGPRAISGKGMTSIGLSVSGDVYIDNEVVYKAEHVDPEPEYGDLVTSYAGGTITVTDANGIAKTAVALVVSYAADGTVSNVERAELTFADGKATVSKTLAAGDKVYVWNTTTDVKPLAAVYEQK